MRRRSLILGGAAMPVAATGNAFAQSPPKVKLFSSSAAVEIDQAALFLGNPLGFFRDEGVEVEFGAAPGSAATLQLIASGQAQLGHLGMDVLILGKAKNPDLPVTAVYLQYRGNIYEIVVPEESDIRAVADLKDKNIGVASLASGAIPAVRAMLTEAKLNPDASVGLIPVGAGAQAAAALRTGRVQALALFRAQHAVIETLGFKFRYFTREAPSTVIAANTGFLRANPEAVVKVLRGVVMASVFAQTNGPATVREHQKLYGKPQGLSDDEAMARATHVLARTSALWKDPRDAAVRWGDMTARQWADMQQFLVAQKLLDKPIPESSLFTTELLDRANAIDLAPVIRRAQSMQ